MSFCGKCGAKNPDEATFCEACGAPLDKMVKAAPEQTKPAPKKS